MHDKHPVIAQLLSTTDNGILVAFKRGVREGSYMDALIESVRLSRRASVSLSDFEIKILAFVGYVFAMHKLHTDEDVSIGMAFGKICESESSERYFNWLVKMSREDMLERLRRVVDMLSQKRVPINYYRLFDDIKYWANDWEVGSKQYGWVKDFYYFK